jgi:chemotaxis methyl-accepting protein methylase
MLDDDAFRRVLEHLDRPWSGFRKVRKGVKKRLRRHMQSLECESFEAYLYILDRQPEARAECEQHLIVTISRFFRDQRLWACLRDRILPHWTALLRGPMRAWSAGCANGEEPYSLAILWEEAETNLRLEVTATDASSQCLARARDAIYGRSSLNQVPQDLRATYFEQTPAGHCVALKPLLKSNIRWQQRDLFDAPPPERFHLIFLRNNLLTYYRGPAQVRAFERIARTLVRGGHLIVGSHERPPPTGPALVSDDRCPWIYQRVFEPTG